MPAANSPGVICKQSVIRAYAIRKPPGATTAVTTGVCVANTQPMKGQDMGTSSSADLREIKEVRQIPGERQRRWFTSNEFDLFFWCDATGAVNSFQLYYDKPRSEHALIWKRGAGSSHFAVDDGEGRPFRHKGSPILVADGHFDVARVADRLASAGGQVPQGILDFILARMREFPQGPGPGV